MNDQEKNAQIVLDTVKLTASRTLYLQGHYHLPLLPCQRLVANLDPPVNGTNLYFFWPAFNVVEKSKNLKGRFEETCE